MFSRALKSTARRCYSDKAGFSVESFVNRIDALAKNRNAGGKKRWEISGKATPQDGQQRPPRRPQQRKPAAAKPADGAAASAKPAQKATRPRPQRSAAPNSSPSTKRPVSSEKRPVIKTAVEADHASSFVQPAFSGFTPSSNNQASKPLAKRRQPFDRRRARKPSARPRITARPNKVNRAVRQAEAEQGVLSGSQALDIVLRSAGSDTTGCINVDRLDLRSVSETLVPSSVTYNTRVWSVLNNKHVSDKNVAQLVEEAVQGRLTEPGTTDEAVANALASNRYLSSDTRMFLSKVAAGKIPLNQIAQR